VKVKMMLNNKYIQIKSAKKFPKIQNEILQDNVYNMAKKELVCTHVNFAIRVSSKEHRSILD